MHNIKLFILFTGKRTELIFYKCTVVRLDKRFNSLKFRRQYNSFGVFLDNFDGSVNFASPQAESTSGCKGHQLVSTFSEIPTERICL